MSKEPLTEIVRAEPKVRRNILAKWNPFRRSAASQPTEQRRRWWRIPRRRAVVWAVTMLISIGAGMYLRAEIYRRVSRISYSASYGHASQGGTLLIAGGGPLSHNVRQQFIELAGGQAARIVVIPAVSFDESMISQYREGWLQFGVNSVDVLCADSRAQADDPEFSQILDQATGVWLGGGTQSWLADCYGRTRVESRLKELLARNGVIGGTSAGAAIMSSIMIAGGREKPTMGRGFDLIPGAIIDQHFVKRNRIRRLQYALERHPDLIGFGIDEGAALQYAVDSGRFRVVGQSCVIACVPHVEPDQRTTFRLEFFNPGDDFDVDRLRRGDAVPPSYIDIDGILLGE